MRGKVVIKIKSPIEAGSKRFAVEDHGPDECCGVISTCLKQLGCGGIVRGKRNGKILYAVRTGKQSGEDCRVRRVRQRAGRECFGKADAVVGDRVDSRRCDSVVAVTVKV